LEVLLPEQEDPAPRPSAPLMLMPAIAPQLAISPRMMPAPTPKTNNNNNNRATRSNNTIPINITIT
jgi:hypothetical protein